MAVGNGHHEVLLEEELAAEIGLGERQVCDREVETSGRELQRQRRGAGLEHHHAHVGVLLLGCREEGRHQPSSGGRDDAEAHLATHLVAQGGDVSRGGLDLGDNAASARNDDLASWGAR